jgi:hypothetical protein
VLFDVACELPLGEGTFLVRLGLDETVVVVERELRVDRDDTIDRHDGIDALAGVEGVLHLVRRRRQAVAEDILEQKLAEPAARLGRPKRLLEAGEILRALEHLRRRLVDLPQPLVDLDRRLRCALEAAVDLRVELSQSAVHRLDDAVESAVDLRVPFRELCRRLGVERGEEAR